MRVILLLLVIGCVMLGCRASRLSSQKSFYSDQLDTIPDSVFKMKNLETLSVAPQWMTINAAFTNDYQSSSSHKIKSLPDKICELAKLKSINLSAQDLTILPECVYRMPYLEQLDLSYNKNFKMKQFFEHIHKFEKLKELTLIGVLEATNDTAYTRSKIDTSRIKLVLTKADLLKEIE